MVADRPGWAYHHLAKFVMRELRLKYDFYYDFCIFNIKEKRSLLNRHIKREILRRFSLIKYQSQRRILPGEIEYDLVCFLGWYFPFAYEFKMRSKGIIQGIFTDGFPPQGHTVIMDPNMEIKMFVKEYLEKSISVICGSRLIYERYRGHLSNLYYCTGGIDTSIFRPFDRSQIDNRIFTVGWTGDPHRPFKGFYDFVVPAVEKASSRYPCIRLKTRFKGPYRTLPDFYKDVDVLLIASTADAGPSSFLEAGACGVPIISTRIGFPAETIRDQENGIFVNRSVDEMAKAIIYLHNHRDLLKAMSRQIRLDIEKNWDYKSRSHLWDRMFRESLSRI